MNNINNTQQESLFKALLENKGFKKIDKNDERITEIWMFYNMCFVEADVDRIIDSFDFYSKSDIILVAKETIDVFDFSGGFPTLLSSEMLGNRIREKLNFNYITFHFVTSFNKIS